MQEFFDIAFSMPTVVFTVTTIFFLGFWMVTSLIGAGADALEDFDIDFDTDVDADVDLDVDVTGGSGGLLQNILQFLGVGSMPLLLGLTLQSLFAWTASMIAIIVIGDGGGLAGAIVGLVVLVGSFLIGLMITRAIARRFAHVFRPTKALRFRELVGSVCTVTTDRVDATFGQAEVRDEEGGSLLVQIRCRHENDYRSGDRALIYDLDRETGEFHISADRSLAP